MRLIYGKDFGDNDQVQIYPPKQYAPYWEVKINYANHEVHRFETTYPVLVHYEGEQPVEIITGEAV
mgnify:CR=1 FL=1